ncbi:hypothetical protein Rsub_11987 [Raphidocelis subcapitata]|uniref:AP2/ERF domain-containing protein n=1 Tax=Raphidocelis subcapitata TaxID=307507 RepID=A0A2V0PJ42_9CHLO|nr:hypothetical protein Rsub_11987 [Raphidocelis subcapitata]|eukprot:GBF99042.1 hypothetical protein Rsub_11987 [Raphidocelis subcapitata]
MVRKKQRFTYEQAQDEEADEQTASAGLLELAASLPRAVVVAAAGGAPAAPGCPPARQRIGGAHIEPAAAPAQQAPLISAPGAGAAATPFPADGQPPAPPPPPPNEALQSIGNGNGNGTAQQPAGPAEPLPPASVGAPVGLPLQLLPLGGAAAAPAPVARPPAGALPSAAGPLGPSAPRPPPVSGKHRSSGKRRRDGPLPCDKLFELPGRPNVLYTIKNYSIDPAKGDAEARAEAPFLFKAFETGQIGGVFWDAKTARWRSQIGHKNRKIFMGYFDSEEEAAREYDMKQIELNGVDTEGDKRMNFPFKDYTPEAWRAEGQPVPPEVEARAAKIADNREKLRFEWEAAAAAAASAGARLGVGGAGEDEASEEGEGAPEGVSSAVWRVRKRRRRAAEANVFARGDGAAAAALGSEGEGMEDGDGDGGRDWGWHNSSDGGSDNGGPSEAGERRGARANRRKRQHPGRAAGAAGASGGGGGGGGPALQSGFAARAPTPLRLADSRGAMPEAQGAHGSARLDGADRRMAAEGSEVPQTAGGEPSASPSPLRAAAAALLAAAPAVLAGPAAPQPRPQPAAPPAAPAGSFVAGRERAPAVGRLLPTFSAAPTAAPGLPGLSLEPPPASSGGAGGAAAAAAAAAARSQQLRDSQGRFISTTGASGGGKMKRRGGRTRPAAAAPAAPRPQSHAGAITPAQAFAAAPPVQQPPAGAAPPPPPAVWDGAGGVAGAVQSQEELLGQALLRSVSGAVAFLPVPVGVVRDFLLQPAPDQQRPPEAPPQLPSPPLLPPPRAATLRPLPTPRQQPAPATPPGAAASPGRSPQEVADTLRALFAGSTGLDLAFMFTDCTPPAAAAAPAPAPAAPRPRLQGLAGAPGGLGVAPSDSRARASPPLPLLPAPPAAAGGASTGALELPLVAPRAAPLQRAEEAGQPETGGDGSRAASPRWGSGGGSSSGGDELPPGSPGRRPPALRMLSGIEASASDWERREERVEPRLRALARDGAAAVGAAPVDGLLLFAPVYVRPLELERGRERPQQGRSAEGGAGGDDLPSPSVGAGGRQDWLEEGDQGPGGAERWGSDPYSRSHGRGSSGGGHSRGSHSGRSGGHGGGDGGDGDGSGGTGLGESSSGGSSDGSGTSEGRSRRERSRAPEPQDAAPAALEA